MTCVECDSRYRVQPRYGATPAKMDEMRVEEEEEGQVLVVRARCQAIFEWLVDNYRCWTGFFD